MRRKLALAIPSMVFLAAAVLLLPSVLATTPPAPKPPAWSAAIDDTAGIYGGNVTVSVIGPANATFYVALSEPPVNYTPPVAIYFYHLPDVTGDNFTPAEGTNASVPLTGVLMGALGVRVYDNATGTILTGSVSVLPSTDARINFIQTNLTNLEVEYNALVGYSRAQADGIAEAHHIETLMEELFVIGTICNVFFTLFVKTERRGPHGWIRSLKKIGHDTKYHRGAVTNGTSELEPRPPKTNPAACYVGKAFKKTCTLCEIPATQGWYVAHITGARVFNGKTTADHGLPKAVLGIHYEKDPDLEAWLKSQAPAVHPELSAFKESLRQMKRGGS